MSERLLALADELDEAKKKMDEAYGMYLALRSRYRFLEREAHHEYDALMSSPKVSVGDVP